MPCYTPEESNNEIESRRVSELILILDKKMNIPSDPKIIQWANSYYENHCDIVTPILCSKIKAMDKDELDKFIYDGRDPYSRRLAEWWDEHKKFDRDKEKNKNTEASIDNIPKELVEWVDHNYEGSVTPEIITMCGSTKFADLMAAISWEYEKLGKIVLRVNYLPGWYVEQAGWNKPSHGAEQDGLKEQLDELHKRKIDICDRVFVCDYGNYIGESTFKEILYAQKIGKPITYMTTGGDDEIWDIINKVRDWFSDSIGEIKGENDLKERVKFLESVLIPSAKYGYEYHANTSFPDKSFKDNCLNNYLQSLIGTHGFTLAQVNKLKENGS